MLEQLEKLERAIWQLEVAISDLEETIEEITNDNENKNTNINKNTCNKPTLAAAVKGRA